MPLQYVGPVLRPGRASNTESEIAMWTPFGAGVTENDNLAGTETPPYSHCRLDANPMTTSPSETEDDERCPFFVFTVPESGTERI